MLAHLLLVGGLALGAQACTAGFVQESNGQLMSNPGRPVYVTLQNNATHASYTTEVNFSPMTVSGLSVSDPAAFSFDPLGPSLSWNDPVTIPAGNYTVFVVEQNVAAWGYPSVNLNTDSNATCPYADFFTGGHSSCQLLQFVLAPPSCAPVLLSQLPNNCATPPVQEGAFLTVHLSPIGLQL